jgi:hypothetical protein
VEALAEEMERWQPDVSSGGNPATASDASNGGYASYDSKKGYDSNSYNRGIGNEQTNCYVGKANHYCNDIGNDSSIASNGKNSGLEKARARFIINDDDTVSTAPETDDDMDPGNDQ